MSIFIFITMKCCEWHWLQLYIFSMKKLKSIYKCLACCWKSKQTTVQFTPSSELWDYKLLVLMFFVCSCHAFIMSLNSLMAQWQSNDKQQKDMTWFTNVEYANMSFVCVLCEGNAKAASKEYQRQYPDQRQSNKHYTQREEGVFMPPARQLRKMQCENVTNTVYDNPPTSTHWSHMQ
jgi:hypothetical protein